MERDELAEIQAAEWYARAEGEHVAVLARLSDGEAVVCSLGEIWETEVALTLARQIAFEHNTLRGVDAAGIKSAQDARKSLAAHVASIGGGL